MSWSIEYNQQNFVEVIVIGRETFDEAIEQTAAIVAEMGARRCESVLLDCRRMRVALSTAEIYRLQDIYRDLGLPLRSRFAILMPTELPNPERHAYEFHELVSRNRGYHVRLFEEQSEALSWLGVRAGSPGSDARDNGGG
ncbi:MAG TPA: hypothetical protein VKA53_08745 [Thermoanaerobaculia bacterium]|nr:hypothetical protein [Thermoanaerobaculia bacterium]